MTENMEKYMGFGISMLEHNLKTLAHSTMPISAAQKAPNQSHQFSFEVCGLYIQDTKPGRLQYGAGLPITAIQARGFKSFILQPKVDLLRTGKSRGRNSTLVDLEKA